MRTRTVLRSIVLLTLVLCLAWGGVSASRPVRRLTREVQSGLDRRAIQPQFAELEAYLGNRLDASSGTNSFRDKTGNCRLSWVDGLLRRPLQSVTEADVFSRELHAAAMEDAEGLGRIVAMAGGKLDAPAPARGTRVSGDGIATVAMAVEEMHAALRESMATLDAATLIALRADLLAESTPDSGPGHRFADPVRGRRVCDLLERMDRRGLVRAASAAARLADPRVWRDIARDPVVQGRVADMLYVPTAAGVIWIGGSGPNRYALDEMSNVCAVVDLGGDDVYLEGTLSAGRPVLAIVDLAGNDTYRGVKPGVQGGAILGASVLVDAAGNDTYEAGPVAQGSCLGGVGLLVDGAGDDRYRGTQRVQGQAVGGLGLLIDRGGNDDYRAALLAQGVGGPLGFGLLDDLAGQDHYYAGGLYDSPYDDSPGFGSFSQGVGVGPRGVANGGIGVLLDGGGDDVYEADYFSHAGGYWFAVGIARDFGGNDQRVGATRTAFDGSPRKPARFVRYGTGYGCHYALGLLFDDSGNDTYVGDLACVAFAWDLSVGVVCDAKGDDRYEVTGSAVGQACNAGLAVLYDGEGNDAYVASQPGFAAPVAEYHADQKCGGNFSFLIDEAGNDSYSAGLTNGVEATRGWAGGFVIDR